MGAILIFSSLAILLKYLIPEAGGSIQFTAFQFVISLVIHLFIITIQILFFTDFPVISLYHVSMVLFATVFGFAGFLCYILGLEIGNASVGAVVLSSRVFFAVPLGIIFLSEIYPPLVYLGIFLAFIGAVLVSWQQNLSVMQIIKFKSPGMRYFLLTALFWSLQNLIIRQLNNNIPLMTLLTLRMIFFTIFALTLYKVMRNQDKISPIIITKGTTSKTILYAIFGLISQLGLVYALGENLSITETIGVFEGTLTFIFSLLFAVLVDNDILQEQLDSKILSIKTLGIIFSVSGTLLTITLI